MKNIKIILLFVIISIYANANVITVLNKNNSGAGSLRDAIANSVSTDTIRFSPSLIASGSDTIKLSTEITTLNNLVIKGLYNSIDTLYISGQNITRVFTFQGTNLTLDSLVLINGRSTNGAAINFTALGAAAFISNSIFKNNVSTAKGGAISFYNGSLNIISTTFRNNSATSDGGAIYCQLGQDVSIYNSHFSNNASSNYGGAMYLGGTNTSNCSILRTTISSNTSSSDGGALCYNGRFFNMDSTIIKFNSAGGLYGGIVFFDLKTSLALIDSYIDNSEIGNNTGLGITSSISLGVSTSTQSKLYVNRCTINNNTFGGIYSLVFADNANSLSLVEVNYSTVTSNGSLSSSSGGIYSYAWGTGTGFSNNSNVKVKNSTVVNNSSSGNGSGVYSYGKIASSSYLEVKSSIVAHNSGVNLFSFSLSSPITSMGDNIFSNSSVIGSSGTDQLGVTVPSLNLGILSNNGGFTKTLRPNTGSVAINLGNTIDLTNAQNGPISGRRDIGSTEWIQCIKNHTYSSVICQGDSVLFNGIYQKITGAYSQTIVVNDCDSIITLNLMVNPAITGSQTLTLCAGQTVTVGNNTYTTSGVYTDVLTAANGCDSTVTTNLTINPAITGSQTLTLCAGQSVTVGTNTYNTSGVYTDVLTATNGCDSTVTTNLTVNPAITGSQTLTLCAGQAVTVGSNTYNTSGVYIDVLTAANGCDSTITTNLTIENAIDISTSTSAETITSNATNTTYQWIDCDNSNQPIVGETNQSFTAIANGNYAVIVTQNACSDTSSCVNISTVGIKEVNNSPNIKLYPNPTNGSFTISGIEINSTISIYNTIGELVKSIQSTENKTTIDLSECSSGIYFIKINSNKSDVVQKIIKQ